MYEMFCHSRCNRRPKARLSLASGLVPLSNTFISIAREEMNTITESTNQSHSASTHNQPDNKDVEEQEARRIHLSPPHRRPHKEIRNVGRK